MARTWLAVDKNGAEKIFNVKPFRGNTQKIEIIYGVQHTSVKTTENGILNMMGAMKIQVMLIIKGIQ